MIQTRFDTSTFGSDMDVAKVSLGLGICCHRCQEHLSGRPSGFAVRGHKVLDYVINHLPMARAVPLTASTAPVVIR